VSRGPWALGLQSATGMIQNAIIEGKRGHRKEKP